MMTSKVLIAAGSALVALLSCRPCAAEPAWPTEPYTYVVIDQDLRDVLEQFGANTGLRVSVSPKVQGRVHGPLPAAPPRQFLDGLAKQFGLEWVYDGSILSVSAASEDETEIVPLQKVPFDKLRDGLASAGLLDSRYQLRPMMGGNAVLVSGPPRFLKLVHDSLAAIPPEAPPVAPPPTPAPPPPPVAAAPHPRVLTVLRGTSSSVVEYK